MLALIDTKIGAQMALIGSRVRLSSVAKPRWQERMGLDWVNLDQFIAELGQKEI